MTLLAFAGVEFAAMPRVEISEAATPVTRVVAKARRFIINIFLSSSDGNVWLQGVGGADARLPMPASSTSMPAAKSAAAKVASAEFNMSKAFGAEPSPIKMAGSKAMPQSARHGFRTK
jgi:hypothetical protein